jgi:hypothetical protein
MASAEGARMRCHVPKSSILQLGPYRRAVRLRAAAMIESERQW